MLKITEKEFYDFLENDLLSNIYQCTGKELSVNDIKKGLKYAKQGKDALTRTDISILDYKRGAVYKSEIKSIADTITISFETEVVKDGLKIVFTQFIKSFDEKKHNKFMKIFSETIHYGRMSDTLYGIEKKILKEHK